MSFHIDQLKGAQYHNICPSCGHVALQARKPTCIECGNSMIVEDVIARIAHLSPRINEIEEYMDEDEHWLRKPSESIEYRPRPSLIENGPPCLIKNCMKPSLRICSFEQFGNYGCGKNFCKLHVGYSQDVERKQLFKCCEECVRKLELGTI